MKLLFSHGVVLGLRLSDKAGLQQDPAATEIVNETAVANSNAAVADVANANANNNTNNVTVVDTNTGDSEGLNAVNTTATATATGTAPTNASAATTATTATVAVEKSEGPPCNCDTNSTKWTKAATPANTPRCFFFDLGASDGETELAFLHKSQKFSYEYYTGNFSKEECTSYLVEANPGFNSSLQKVSEDNGGISKVVPLVQKAIYMCDKQEENFFLDVTGPGGWGSALDKKHSSVKDTTDNSNKTLVKVELINLLRLLHETVTEQDFVVLKMDIEGAEFDILPCLAQSAEASKLVDYFYMENHCPEGPNGQWCPSMGQAGNSKEKFDEAVNTMKGYGVQFPDYYSPL